jgi:hypothetical protein
MAKQNKGKGRKQQTSMGFQPKAGEGESPPSRGSRLTGSAERRSGQDAEGRGPRQAPRDPKDGGRPKGKGNARGR